MPQGAREDRFANVMAAKIVMASVNTLAFTEILTGISLGQGVGILIDEIDYHFVSGTYRELITAADDLAIAVTTSNAITDIEDHEDRRIIHGMSLISVGVPVAVHQSPYIHQFFPPMIIAAPRIYLAMNTSGFGGPGTGFLRLFFRYISLTPQQYIELAEAFVLVG